MKQVFIDGSAGTTGLRLQQRLQQREDISLIEIEPEHRKNPHYRRKAMEQADAVVLCLPDQAAIEAAELFKGCKGVLLDTSTAHRTAQGWVYGLPQLSKEQKNAIQQAKQIAVPGCHACGFIALVQPLVQQGIIAKDQPLCCFSLTGYSGGGKSMIAQYQHADRSILLDAPRMYGLSQQHKHLKEMQAFTQLQHLPLFSPIVGDFYSGMEVVVQLHRSQLNKGDMKEICHTYANHYTDEVIKLVEDDHEEGFLSVAAFSGKDTMRITVCGNEERILLVARYDNLGKGASGGAVECLNLALGMEQTAGLQL